MKNIYKPTVNACFVGYIVQAIIVNFIPLLFLLFQESYGIPLAKITLLIAVNFGVQLLTDVVSIGFIDKIGYRTSMVMAHVFAAAGLISLTLLPELLRDPFAGLLCSVVIYAIGGGLLEVLVSPVVEACPADNKATAMSLLHSFYSWGQVGVVLLSTLFFWLFDISNWKILTLLWAAIPIANAVAFTKVPMVSMQENGRTGLSLKALFSQKIFWLLLLMMLCAGASEQAVSQWASVFAEQGLGVSKTVGDLAGPMAFAVLMGLSRLFYGKYGETIRLDRFMTYSSLLCVASYLCISLVPLPGLNLIACGVCGLAVGILWPGTFSKASASIRSGGTAMFALLALAGDFGCSAGPSLAGMVASLHNNNLKTGILAAIVFPLLLLLGIAGCRRLSRRDRSAANETVSSAH